MELATSTSLDQPRRPGRPRDPGSLTGWFRAIPVGEERVVQAGYEGRRGHALQSYLSGFRANAGRTQNAVFSLLTRPDGSVLVRRVA